AASCPPSAASEAVSACAMILTTPPQHNAAPPNAH
ncbi:lipoate--protein ligase, partial [Vibrio cholerae]